MRNFSQELIDLVIDCVSQRPEKDPNIVARCGLVCKRWLPRSRFHVFSNMSMNGSRMASFLDIAETSSLELLPLIRSLFLVFPVGAEHLTKLRECRNLTGIRLLSHGNRNTESVRGFLDAQLLLLGAHCPSLSRLELDTDMETIPLRMIADIFASVPSMEALKLIGFPSRSRIASEDVPRSLPFPAHFHTLEIAADGVDSLFAWFLSLPVLPTIKSLTLFEGYAPQPQDPSLVEYSRRAGSGLESLSLWTVRTSDGSFGILKYARQLRHLTIKYLEPSEAPQILAAVPSSNVETIDIHLRTPPDTALYALIDQALAHPRLSTLKRFVLRTQGDFPNHLVRNAEPRMPLANARGILYISA
ncbi:hypothetical protein FB451DRAFT_1558256 [Mycena latifolia]|nr:hypothetical protein FB451DRAFT_1558256 [Mycena latifolia]